METAPWCPQPRRGTFHHQDVATKTGMEGSTCPYAVPWTVYLPDLTDNPVTGAAQLVQLVNAYPVCILGTKPRAGMPAGIPSVYMERVGCSELCAVAIRRRSGAGGTLQGGEGSQWCPGMLLSGPIKSLAAGHWAREHRLARPSLDVTIKSNEFKCSCWHQTPALCGKRVLCFLSLTWLL